MRRLAAHFGFLVLFLFAASGTAWAETTVYRYDVIHPEHGNIGLYTNTITRDGETTKVENRLDIEVRVLGFSAFELEARRRERWKDGRLVAYEGVTNDNGDVLRLTGRAQGEHFIIDGPKGRLVAPADVFPTNPWSPRFRQARVLMATKTGRLDRVQVGDGRDAWMKLNGQRIPVRHYAVRGNGRYDVWFSREGVPLRFDLVQKDATIRFVLKNRR